MIIDSIDFMHGAMMKVCKVFLILISESMKR